MNFEELLGTLKTYALPMSGFLESRTGEEFRWWGETVAGAGIVLSRRVCSIDWSLTLETSEEALCVIIPLAGGSLEAEIDNQEMKVLPGTALIVAAPSVRRIRFRCAPQLSYVGLFFDSATVARVLLSVLRRAVLSELHLAPLFDLSTGTGVLFRRLAETLEAGLADGGALSRSPRLTALLVEAALRTIFENVPHRLSGSVRPGILDSAPQHVRLAVNFMHANMHRPITVDDVAHAAGTSLRSLQVGFRQYLHVVPTAYLRRIRLEAAHRLLSLPDNRLPISTVALKSGFSHLGRFSAEYRSLYGVSPVETVAKARLRK